MASGAQISVSRDPQHRHVLIPQTPAFDASHLLGVAHPLPGSVGVAIFQVQVCTIILWAMQFISTWCASSASVCNQSRIFPLAYLRVKKKYKILDSKCTDFLILNYRAPYLSV